jgi:hypothetical protein
MRKLCLRPALLVALASSGWAAAQPRVDPQAAAPPDSEVEAPAQPLETAERQRKDLAVWYGHVESDNLERTAAGGDGSYESIGLLLGLGHTSTRLEASIDADLEYRRYSLDTLDNETVGTLSAAADVAIVQDRFSWTFRDDYGQGITDPFVGLGPGNREKINVIGTGPRLALPLGARTSVEIRGTYSRRRFDESSQIDNDSVLSELGLYRQISRTARIGLVASWNDVEYVDVIAPEYRIDRLGLRYEKELATGRVLADVGTNEITAGPFQSDEPLYNFVWTRSLTARSELSIRAARELTDAGGALASGLGPGIEGESFTDVVVTPNPFEQQRFGVSYVLTMSRTVVSADISSWKDEYIGNPTLDNDSTTLHASFVRTISPRLTFGIGFDEVDRDFGDSATPQPDGEDSWLGAWLNRTLGRRFSLALAIANYERSGGESYDERRYELRFGYSPTDSGVAAMRYVGR